MANLFIRKLLGSVLCLSSSPLLVLGSSQIGPSQHGGQGADNADSRPENPPQEGSDPDSGGSEPPIPADLLPGDTPETRLSFKLIDGEGSRPMTMTATSWDKNGLVGPIGDIAWQAIDPRDVWRIYPRLMDPTRAETWVELGGIMLYAQNDTWAQNRSQQAFDRALAIDPGMKDQIATVKKEVTAQLAAESKEQAVRDAHKVSRSSPELGPWPEGLWPPQTVQEQAAHKVEVDHLLKSLLEDRPEQWKYEDGRTFVIVHGGLESPELAKISDELNTHLKRLERSVPQEGYLIGSDHFYGPVAVIVSGTPEEFRLLEVDAFRQVTAPGTVGITHYKEAIVLVHISKTEDPEARTDALQRNLTLGYLHRHISPDRLPAWMQEGLGPALVRLDNAQLPSQLEIHAQGVQAIRAGASVRPIFNLDYGSKDWPGPENVGVTFGYLTVVALYRLYPEQTVQWIRAMKFGVPWVEALYETVGLTPDQLANIVNQYWRVND